MSVKNEIEDLNKRINKREKEVNNDLIKLNKRETLFNILAWIAVAFGFITGLYGLYLFKYGQIDENALYGLNLLGDYLSGSVASIWSLAGLFFIYVAFLGQKQQLLNQQLEMLYSQREVKYTQREFHYQKEEMKEQNFQAIFFSLLKTQQTITKEIESEITRMCDYMEFKKHPYNGRMFFQQSKTELEDLISGFKLPNLQVFQDDIEPVQDDYEKEAKLKVRKKQLALRKYGITTEDEFQRIKNLKGIDFSREIYNLFFEKHQYVIGHYFRHLYHILSFLSKEKKSRIEEASEKINHSIDNEIKKFADFVQAQVSTYELFLLFYNALEHPKMRGLMIEFDFFKNIPDDVLISDEDKKALESYMEESKN